MNAMTASCAGLVVPRTTPKEIRTAAKIKTYILENRVIMIEYQFPHGIMKYSNCLSYPLYLAWNSYD